MAKQTDPTLLRCLAIQQPWAWAVCAGIKTVENRTQPTPHVGRDVAILASTTRTNVTALIRDNATCNLNADFFTFGAIIGVAHLADVVAMNSDLEQNPSAVGPYCWIMENPRLLPRPIPSRGNQNPLYRLTEAESNAVRAQLPSLQPVPLSAEDERWAEAYHTRCAVGRSLTRGHSYNQFEATDDAIRSFDLAIQEQPDEPSAFAGRAVAYLWGRRDAASTIRDCTEALRLNPDAALLYLMRYAAYRLMGDLARAAEDRRAATALDPDRVANWQDVDWS